MTASRDIAARGSIVHLTNPDDREKYCLRSPHGYVVIATKQAHGTAYLQVLNDDDTPLTLLASLFAVEARLAALEDQNRALEAATIEKCAKLAESLPGQRGNSPEHLVGRSIAAAIRALASIPGEA